MASQEGIHAVNSCEDTGESEVSPQTGDEGDIYRCEVQYDGSNAALGLDDVEGGAFEEICFLVTEEGDAHEWFSCEPSGAS